MVTFSEFLGDAASKGEFVNVLFEERVFELIGTLQKLSAPLERAGVPHELVGGLAVFLHVENADSTHSSLTRDIDVMILRDDLARVVAIAEEHGFRFRHSAGLDTLLFGETNSARNAIHLLLQARRLRRPNSSLIPRFAPFAWGYMARIS